MSREVTYGGSFAFTLATDWSGLDGSHLQFINFVLISRSIDDVRRS